MAVIAIFACFSFVFVTNKIIHLSLSDKASAAVNELSSEVLDILEPSMQKLANWSSIVRANHDKNVLQKVLDGLCEDLSDDSAFYYATDISRFSKGGFFLIHPYWVPENNWEPRTRPWFTDAVANSGQFTYCDPYLDDRTGSVCVTFSESVSDSGVVLGVAGLDITLNGLVDLVRDINLSENSTVSIVTNDGTYLSDKDESKIFSSNYFDNSRIAEFCSRDEYFDGVQKAFTEGGRFYAVKKIGNSPWFAVVEGPISDFNSFFRKMAFSIVVSVVFFAVVGSFFISLFLKSVRRKNLLLGEKVADETRTLAVAAKENAATSQDQSAAIKEIVSTMEDNNELSGSISTKITDVASIANKTSADVLEGVSALSKNVEQLHAIFDANQNTINGIKALGEKIENIWEIVSLINSVADQAKIIAFNAELEASSAGEAGKNFHIVATEIRRLSDGIIDGTKEIKERISEIQQSSDSLILASENGTEKIKEGYGSARELEEKFNSIKTSSEMTATSAGEITSIVQQQVVSSNQILMTVKQISAGVENSFQATESISVIADNLHKVSEELNK
nr:hypothetical protein [Treponema sp.]